jgi:hypothetical protein
VPQFHAEATLQAILADERVDQFGVGRRDDMRPAGDNGGSSKCEPSDTRPPVAVSAVSLSKTTARFAARSNPAKDE